MKVIKRNNEENNEIITPMQITKTDELVDAIASRCDLTKTQIKECYDAFVSTITDVATASDSDETKIVLPNIGKFIVYYKNAYESKNPKTGEIIQVPTKKRIRFNAFDKFSETINE